MKPLTLLYWTRAGLGITIGILCALYLYLSPASELTNIYTLLTGLSFAILFFMATYYILKPKFLAKIEKRSKIMTQGIGIYFFAWIVSWTLVVTALMPSVMVNIYSNGDLANGQEFWVVARNNSDQVIQNVTTTTGTLRMTLLPPGTYTFEIGNIPENHTPINQDQEISISWLEFPTVVFNVTQAVG